MNLKQIAVGVVTGVIVLAAWEWLVKPLARKEAP